MLQTGTYYIAVHEASNDDVDGAFNRERTPTATGTCRFSVSAQTMPTYSYTLTNAGESRSYTDNSQTVLALGGNDAVWLRGGSELDLLFGGAGADVFRFLPGEGPASAGYILATHDRSEDFDYRQGDRIDLTDLAFGTLGWRGMGGFSAANQVRVVNLSNGDVEVQVNLDTDAASEFDIMVRPAAPGGLIASDFLL